MLGSYSDVICIFKNPVIASTAEIHWLVETW